MGSWNRASLFIWSWGRSRGKSAGPVAEREDSSCVEQSRNRRAEWLWVAHTGLLPWAH